MNLSLAGWLLVAVVALISALVFTSQRWLTADSRCDARIERERREAVEAERERATKADAEAARLFVSVRSSVSSDLQTAAAARASRAERIHTIVVRGECRMPDGLPSLAPAVEEARDAAAD